MTKCPKCKFYSICGGRLNETVENCVKFKSVEQTNEEWFCQLPTEEKAKFFGSNGMRYCVCGCKACIISEQCKSGGIRKTHEEMWVEWLKEVHKE